jgi:hypothetical protein
VDIHLDSEGTIQAAGDVMIQAVEEVATRAVVVVVMEEAAEVVEEAIRKSKPA